MFGDFEYKLFNALLYLSDSKKLLFVLVFAAVVKSSWWVFDRIFELSFFFPLNFSWIAFLVDATWVGLASDYRDEVVELMFRDFFDEFTESVPKAAALVDICFFDDLLESRNYSAGIEAINSFTGLEPVG